MALSKRELRILYLTVAIIFAVVLWTQGIDPIYSNYVQNRDVLDKEEATYRKNVDTLNTAREIEEGFKKIEATFPEDDPDRDPEQVFSEEIVHDAQNIVPGKVPVPGNPQREEIKGVEGYEFLTFPISVSGELENMAQLLKGFQLKGYLIKEMSLQQAKGIDNPELKLDLTMARIVKNDQDEAGAANRGSRHSGFVHSSGGRR
jgi:hypothetical protein